MNFLFPSFFLCLLVLIHLGHSDATNSLFTQRFIRQFKEDFQPIERGENAYLEVDFRIALNDNVVFYITYKLWTRMLTHQQWASKMNVELVSDYPGKWTYSSVFRDGRLFTNSTRFFAELPVFKDWMQKGPQIYSLIDEWMQEENGSERVEETRDRTVYYKQIVLQGVKANFSLTRKFNNAKKLVYAFKLLSNQNYIVNDDQNKVDAHFELLKLQVNQAFDDAIFNVSDF